MTTASSKQPKSRLVTAGRVLTIVGTIIMVLSVAGGILLAVSGFGTVANIQDEGTEFSGQGQVTLEAGEQIQLYYRSSEVPPTCDVMGPGGTDPGPGVSQTSSVNDWSSFDSFSATTAGDYTITCSGTQQVLAAPPLSIGGIFSGTGGILLAVFGGGLGVLMLGVGIVLWIVGRNQAKNRPQQAGPQGQGTGGFPGQQWNSGPR